MPQSPNPDDLLQWVFFAFAALIMLSQMVFGWKRGVARQFVHLVALVLSTLAAWFCAPLLVPRLRPLGYPDMSLSLIAGVVIGLVVFFAITLMGMVLFKKTSRQRNGIVRFFYGMAGAVLAMVSGLAFVLVALVIVRVLGAVAQSEITIGHAQAAKHPNEEDGVKVFKPSGMVLGLAAMKRSLENGPAGDVVKQVDPLPKKVYVVLDKMMTVLANPDDSKRFLDYPGAQALVADPKIAALRDDPDIMKEIRAKNYVALFKNPNLVNAVNDPALLPLLKKFDIEKALDYSLDSTQKDMPAGNQ